MIFLFLEWGCQWDALYASHFEVCTLTLYVVYHFQLDDTVSYILLSLLFGTVSPSPVSYLVSEGRRPV